MKYKKILIFNVPNEERDYLKGLMGTTPYLFVQAFTYAEAVDLMGVDYEIAMVIIDISSRENTLDVVVGRAIKNNIPVLMINNIYDLDLVRKYSELGVVEVIHRRQLEDMQQVVSFLNRMKENSEKNLLIVGDSIEFRKNIHSILSTHNFTVFEAADKIEGLKIIEENMGISLVITPDGMEGIKEMVYAIRQNFNALQLPVLIVIEHDEIHSTCLKESATDYIKKPFSAAMFIRRIYLNLDNSDNFKKLKEYRSLLEQYKVAIDQSTILSKTDSQGIITYANDEFCKCSGFSRKELIGKSHRVIHHPDTPVEQTKKLWSTIL